MSLATKDFLFTILHLAIIGFNLFGFIPKTTRKIHFWFTMLTLFCWSVLGICYGLGYCPITDWHWQIKEKMGEINLPDSFIKYFADGIFQTNFNADFIDGLTLGFFLGAIGISVWLNFFKKPYEVSKTS